MGTLSLDGSVVKMKGLPFRATKQDILEFFQGFNIVSHSTLLRKNADGRASGEAYVTFASPEEATRAVSKVCSSIPDDTSRSFRHVQHFYFW
mmetsp:Transcript_3819/g.9084  ORF Transcript_3819/g.9084 Transcript_3819/m.9084 type:complete len:92 (-) Transcript_3819:195-470(-)